MPRNISITDSTAVREILNRAVDVFNIPLLTLQGKGRQQKLQIARMVVSNICREQDIHWSYICPEIKRDRTSVYHYHKRHKELYGRWPKYRDAFNALYNQLFTNPLPILNTKGIKDILDDAGIKDTEGKITIIITSGNSRYSIRENIAAFSTTTQKIRELFKDYYHTIDIRI